MAYSLLFGFLFVLILYLFRMVFTLVVSKLNGQNFLNDFEFDPKQFFFEIFFFGLIFLCFYLVGRTTSLDYLQHIISVLLVLSIPTYVYVIQPIFYLMEKNNLTDDNKRVKNYRVKIIDKDLINAYATGIVPFSKTILVGKPLMEHLTKEELLSIQLHEAGHLEKNHLNKMFFTNILLSVLFYLALVFRSQYLTTSNELLNIITIGIFGLFYGFLLWYIPGKIQYRFELEADKYSAKNNGRENLINALKKLDILSKGDVSKGWLTHPKLSVRIKNVSDL